MHFIPTMEPPPIAPSRQYALDNLRALMMWLGIVLHVSASHMTGPLLVPWRDPATSPWADLLEAVIHTFRMPVFLILAGYFVALLVERRGARRMLVHRMRRIALPFVVFWPPVFLLTGVLVTLYVHKVSRGYFGLDPGLIPSLPNAPVISTIHLWFLYQLTGFALLSFAALWLAKRLPPNVRDGVAAAFRILGERAWGFAVLAFPLGWIGAQYAQAVLVVNGSFTPHLYEWLHHGLFYCFGYFLYVHRQVLLTRYAKHALRYMLLGAVMCCVSVGLLLDMQRQPNGTEFGWRLLAAWSYTATTWLWCFGLIGLALRYLDRQSKALQYMSDSSYWVYLVHLPLTIGLGALLCGIVLPAEVKMLANIFATTVVGLVSYKYLVRNTMIGQLLNGKRMSHGPH